ncbi:DMT family transporter [Oricola sp.]|uniref:DMT family transporter n=1 Tax=Oricola sp. TaxID=1979950 RepID=UPI003BABBF31
MSIYELAALGAALTWAVTGIVSAGPSAALGAVAFNRLRMALVFVMLAITAALTGGWQTIGTANLAPLVLSGLIGIFLGDTALFLTMNRLGPRRTNILFSCNAPMAAILGWLVLGEAITTQKLAGIAVVFTGVLLAIVFGKRPSQMHQWEAVRGPLAVGVALGLTAALGQAIGSLIARPVMEAGVDPIAASAVRVGTSVLALSLLIATGWQAIQAKTALTLRLVFVTGVSGMLGLGVGMTLVLFALVGGKVGIVATLSATTPAFILPVMWMRTGERPAAMAWLGAALVIAGSALIFAS